MLHAWSEFGYEDAQDGYIKKNGVLQDKASQESNIFSRVIKGKLDFLKMVRGYNDPLYRKLLLNFYHLSNNEKGVMDTLSDLKPSSLRSVEYGSKNWDEWQKTYKKSILFLQVTNNNGDKGNGTAFVVSKNTVITAGHNIHCMKFELFDGMGNCIPYQSSKCINIVRGVDVGIIELDIAYHSVFTPIPSQQRVPPVGEEIAAIGYPALAGRQNCLSVQTGNTESFPKNYKEDTQFIQVSFTNIPGMSGSPVIDSNGYFVGIVIENVSSKTEDSTLAIQSGQLLPAIYADSFRKGYISEKSYNPD